MDSASLGWIFAGFFFGMIAGGVLIYLAFGRQKPPVLMPYKAPSLTTWARDQELPEEQLRDRAQAVDLMVSEEEIRDLIGQIMRETGVDEMEARKEVNLILAEAGALGQA